MRFSWLRWKAAVAVAFLMGLPMVEQTKASDASGITGGALSLTQAIIDAAGNS